MGITIKKIANDLQLAVSTVSKALRDSHEISPETKRRVFEYAAKVDYLPNPYASSLKRRLTRNIAVVIPEVADSFFSTAINGIEAVAQQMGYHVMVYLTHEDPIREQSILREFRSGRVDGVLISVSANNKNTKIYQECAKEIPLVFFDRVCEETQTAKIVTDDLDSGYKAAEHLIERGCRHIAFLSMTSDLSIINKRLEGCRKACHDHGITFGDQDVVPGTHNEAGNILLLTNLLTREKRPDGLVGSVEKIALQAYAVCNSLAIQIPQQIKIIGFSSLSIAALLNPSLTTITQPAFKMGEAAASVLFKVLERKKISLPVDKMVLPSVLIERTSTRQ